MKITPYRLEMNYELNYPSRIQDANLNSVHPLLTAENFPPRRAGFMDLEAELMQFTEELALDNGCHSDLVYTAFKREGVRPATLGELLTFAVQHPEEPARSSIWAFGSPWLGWHHDAIPGLIRKPDGRHLRLRWFNVGPEELYLVIRGEKPINCSPHTKYCGG